MDSPPHRGTADGRLVLDSELRAVVQARLEVEPLERL